MTDAQHVPAAEGADYAREAGAKPAAGAGMSGHAKLFAQPAYERLIGAEPFLKHLIPILIVAFLVVVAAARYINISDNHDRLRSAAEQVTALSLAAAHATLSADLEPVRASLRWETEARLNRVIRAMPDTAGRYLLVLDGNERVFAVTAGGYHLLGKQVEALLPDSSPLRLFGERAGVQETALNGEQVLAAMSRLPDGAGAILSVTPISDMNGAWRQSVSVNVTLFIATSSILLVILYAYFSQAGRAQEADDIYLESHRRVDMALSRGRCGLWDWDMARGRVYWSRSMYEILGLPPRDSVISFREASHLIHPDDGDLYEIAQMVASGDIRQVDHLFRMRHADGHYLWMRARAQVVDPTSAQTHLIGIAMDVTEQHRLQQRTVEADQRLFDAIESTSEAFVLWDRDDRLVLWNKHYQEIHGLPADSLSPGTPRSVVEEAATRPVVERRLAVPCSRDSGADLRGSTCGWPLAADQRTPDTRRRPGLGGYRHHAAQAQPGAVARQRKTADGNHRRPHFLPGRTQAQGRRALRTQPRLPDRDRAGGSGKQGQVRIPRQYEPRAENTAQCHYRFFRSAAGAHVRTAGVGQVCGVCRRHPQFRHSSADRDQRHSRHGQDRSRSDAPRLRGRGSCTAA
jgi:two-component system cell cycle sensor histidine kinase PleC